MRLGPPPPQPGQAHAAGAGGLTPVRASFGYDPETGKKNHDSFGFLFGSRSEETTYTYNETGRLASAVTAGSTPSSRTWAYDATSGALTSVGGSGGYTLTYDGSGRVASVAGGAYAHDTLGRRTSQPNRTFTWAGERLVSTSGSPSATYVYDASGQRVRSVVVSGSVTTTTTFDYDGLTLRGLFASASDGTTWSVDYLADEGARPVAGVYASGATRVAFAMVTTDRGDVRELLDASGAAFAHYAYDAYGNPTATLSTATAGVLAAVAQAIATRQPLRYAGYAWDSETNLYYCSQRYYDPRTASFISKDPARADGEESAYQYCAGDPVGGADPTGLRMVSPAVSNRMQSGNGCWVVVSWMILRQQGVSVTEEEIYRFVYPDGDLYAKRASVIQVKRVLKNWGLCAHWWNYELSWKKVKSHINANRPIAAFAKVPQIGKHYVCIKGYDVGSDGTKYLYYADPGCGLSHKAKWANITSESKEWEDKCGMTIRWDKTVYFD